MVSKVTTVQVFVLYTYSWLDDVCPTSTTLAGTALATGGEDGTVKIWSRNGMLRSTISQCDSPVYSVVWAADSDQLCYSTGSHIVIKSIQSSAKQTSWKAHDGVVLKVDWSAINHMIVSGGEDCKYKVHAACVT